jgi:PAS domain S-box-containing protein
VREWTLLTMTLLIAAVVAGIGVAINFNQYLAGFFRPHAHQPLVQFLIQVLVVWMVVLLGVSYSRWRNVANRSAELEDIVDSINPDVLVVVDADRNILMSNATVTRMFGYSLHEVIDRKTDLLYFDRRSNTDQRHEIYDALEKEGFHVGWATGRRKDGSTFPLEIITGRLRYHGGSVLLLRDVTERKQAEALLLDREAQLRQSQKMEALGLLAGGVAHDFNNLLTSILGFGNLAFEALPEGHQARADIKEVIGSAERAAKLTAQLLAVGRKQPLKIQAVDLNGVMDGMGLLLKRTLGEHIAMDIRLGSDTGFVEADSSGVEQVVLNLIVNARDAMPQGGKLTIKTEKVTLDESYCRTHVGVEPGTYSRLVVHDTGCGMTKDVMERIFEPFFTTKEKGKGTGLGMSTVYGIVRQCRGYIEVSSAPGQGAQFQVYLRSVSPPQEREGGEGKPPAPEGTETILVVEDDEAVRNFAVRVLGSLGYRVLAASRSAEALQICQDHKDPIDLVLTDVVLPDKSGSGWVEEAGKIRHDFKVLYVTGFDQQSLTLHGLSPAQHETVIMKPYSQNMLATKVRQVLDTPV